MKKEYKNQIVQKSSKIEIGVFNNSSEYIVTHKELGNRIVINKKTLEILNLVDDKTSLENIVLKYNRQNPTAKLNINVAYSILYDKLSKFGIIINENISLNKKEVASYLALSFTLVNRKVLEIFIKILSPIFIFKHFYKILSTSLIIVLCIVLTNYKLLSNNILEMNFLNWIFYLIMSGIIIFLHEFGHATACKKLGAEPGTIGFGFYLLSPVMFADVSDTWKLKREERVYVNFAGLYIEILTALLLAIIYIFTKQISLLILCSIILFSFIINLNPLLRYDGYWILSDITNTPNLRKVSVQKLNLFFKYLIGKTKFHFSSKNIFLIVYASISFIFILFFLGFIILNDPNSILSLPIDLYTFFGEIKTSEKTLNFLNLSRFILPFLFYFIVIKFIVKLISKRLKKNNTFGNTV